MTPEREKYARLRIRKLIASVEIETEAIDSFRSRPLDAAERQLLEAAIKRRNSSTSSLKRWKKELGET